MGPVIVAAPENPKSFDLFSGSSWSSEIFES
jgi:hypothetical protein